VSAFLYHILQQILRELTLFVEFLVSELALAKISVPSFTIEKPSLLSPVLESHPPNAIITHSFFVEQVLELILDRHEASHHTIIVVGSVGLPAGLNKLQGQVRIIQWEDLFKSDTKEAELPLIRKSTLCNM